MDTKFSIIMNCYNGEKYLNEAIESILDQTYKNWELIFVDNCSTDGSAKIFKNYSDDRFKYIKTETNICLGAARDVGMRHAVGDWIAFLDTDDIWYPNKLEVQSIHISNHTCVLCYAGINEIDQSGKVIRKYIPKNENANLSKQLVHFDINMVTPIISRSFLNKFKISFNPQIEASEEYNLFLRILAKGNGSVIEEVLGEWRIHDGSLTERAIASWAKDRKMTVKQLIDENPEYLVQRQYEISHALARAYYYDARYQFSKGKKYIARKALRKASQINKIYYLLLLLSFSRYLWNIIHSNRLKRQLSNIGFIKKAFAK